MSLVGLPAAFRVDGFVQPAVNIRGYRTGETFRSRFIPIDKDLPKVSAAPGQKMNGKEASSEEVGNVRFELIGCGGIRVWHPIGHEMPLG